AGVTNRSLFRVSPLTRPPDDYPRFVVVESTGETNTEYEYTSDGEVVTREKPIVPLKLNRNHRAVIDAAAAKIALAESPSPEALLDYEEKKRKAGEALVREAAAIKAEAEEVEANLKLEKTMGIKPELTPIA